MSKSSDRGGRAAMKVAWRPNDFAPAQRVYLFGLDSLSPAEFSIEGTRMSGGRPAYGDDVYLRADRMRREIHS